MSRECAPADPLRLVRVEYTDSDGVSEDTVLWEREHGRDLLEPNALPQVQSEPSMEQNLRLTTHQAAHYDSADGSATA